MLPFYQGWLRSWVEVDFGEYLDGVATGVMSLTRYGHLTLSEASHLPRSWVARFGRALDKMLEAENAPPGGG